MMQFNLNRFFVLLAAIPLLALTGCGGEGEETRDWDYTLEGENGDTVLETEGFTLVFQGQPTEESFSGSFRVAGPSRQEVEYQVGNRNLVYLYNNGVAEIEYGEHTVTITEGGEALAVGDTIIQLEDHTPRIVIGPEGAMQIDLDD